MGWELQGSNCLRRRMTRRSWSPKGKWGIHNASMSFGRNGDLISKGQQSVSMFLKQWFHLGRAGEMVDTGSKKDTKNLWLLATDPNNTDTVLGDTEQQPPDRRQALSNPVPTKQQIITCILSQTGNEMTAANHQRLSSWHTLPAGIVQLKIPYFWDRTLGLTCKE